MKPIYFDYAATTPVDPRVAKLMRKCLTQEGAFGNPASSHVYGQEARDLVEAAREQVASTVHVEPSEIIWTSGATESNNLALKGVASMYLRKGKHLVTMKTEHKSVLDTCQYLEKKGYSVTYLSPEPNGVLNIDKLKDAIRDDTILVSVMHVNNETGVIQDLEAITEVTSSRGVYFHVDAAQSIGKLTLDLSRLPVHLVSFCAHKAYGPKGIGALYVRKKPRVRLSAMMHGGGHEQGMRSGTLATHQIVGMGEAFRLAALETEENRKTADIQRSHFIQGISGIIKCRMNTDVVNSVPHIINFRFEHMLAEAVLSKLPKIATSSASACQGKGTEGSYVLRAMGFTEDEAKSSIRFSLGRFTTGDEINEAVTMINELFLQ